MVCLFGHRVPIPGQLDYDVTSQLSRSSRVSYSDVVLTPMEAASRKEAHTQASESSSRGLTSFGRRLEAIRLLKEEEQYDPRGQRSPMPRMSQPHGSSPR